MLVGEQIGNLVLTNDAEIPIISIDQDGRTYAFLAIKIEEDENSVSWAPIPTPEELLNSQKALEDLITELEEQDIQFLHCAETVQ